MGRFGWAAGTSCYSFYSYHTLVFFLASAWGDTVFCSSLPNELCLYEFCVALLAIQWGFPLLIMLLEYVLSNG